MPKTPRFSPTAPDGPRTVEILAFPQTQLLDVAGPLQVFATANEHLGLSPVPYEPRVVGLGGSPIMASCGLGLVVSPLPSATAKVDTLIVAGGPGVTTACADPALVAFLDARAAQARRVASVCTGAFLLAATGRLDGRRAATHWAHCERLKALHPRIRVEADPIFVRDGPVWTSAGVTAGIDLALALVEEDLGRGAALAIARHLVMFLKRPGGQAQFSATLALQVGEDRFADLHAWIGENLAADLTLPVLAARVGMSERTLSRRYRETTGATPAKGIERLRLEAARRALAETRVPVKRIARECGFGSEETMRRAFLRHVAATPQAYRERFGA